MATKRQQQAYATKASLLKAANKLMSEKGYDAVSVNDITSACGVSTGTFYLYFKSKEELLIYFSHEVHSRIQKLLCDKTIVSGLEQLRQILSIWETWHNNTDQKIIANINNVYVNMFLNEETHPQKNHATFEEEAFQSCLMRAVEQGELVSSTPVAFLSRLMGINIHGMTAFYSYGLSREDIDIWWRDYNHYVFEVLLKPYMVDAV